MPFHLIVLWWGPGRIILPGLLPSSSHFQWLVLEPVRLDRFRAESAFLVVFVVFEVAFEPFDVAVAFEGEDVGGDAVEEPAVPGGHVPS